MTPQEFIAKWKPVELSERSACQQHFLDLCALLGQPEARGGRSEWDVVHLTRRASRRLTGKEV